MALEQTISLRAVGRVVGGRDEPVDDGWEDVRSAIELDPRTFDASALAGLESFSHAEIVFLFDRVSDADVTFGARHPRGRSDWPRVGIFAQRGKNRPNRLGVSICRIISISGLRLEVMGLDAIDGTQVLDIKPVMTGFLPRQEVDEPEWAREIMRHYWTA